LWPPPQIVIYAPLNASGIQALNTFIAIFKNHAITALGRDVVNRFPPEPEARFQPGFEHLFGANFYRLENYFDRIPWSIVKGTLDFLDKYEMPDAALMRGAVDAYYSNVNHNLLEALGPNAISFSVNVPGPRGGLLGAIADFVQAVKEFPGKMAEIYDLIDQVASLVAGAAPKMVMSWFSLIWKNAASS